MQNINLKYSVNPLENLFIYKSIELLSIYSIDSYRIRLHNPKIMRTFEPKMLADRHRTTANSF